MDGFDDTLAEVARVFCLAEAGLAGIWTTMQLPTRMEVLMSLRMRLLLCLGLVLASLTIAGAKKKDELPAYVLKAHTVAVLIDPNAGVSISSPLANKKAQDDVEQALMKWGRFKFVLDPQSADLVIVIRKGSGKMIEPTIGGMPTNDRPVIVQKTDNTIRLGGQQGRAPGAPQQPMPQDTSPTPQMEMSSPDDQFTVYAGNTDTPFEQRPVVWRYWNKNALRSPEVPAVAEFRKAIESSEKQQKSKP